ncbi:MAG TPA: DUF2330 domain-containing protein [Sandaracinaceae bacterium LLY-WYZ-13_1]|nr:DUF2330 domain-containing protein [Sandaracinaceae bacterium LLY-WYZ-13_1]
MTRSTLRRLVPWTALLAWALAAPARACPHGPLDHPVTQRGQQLLAVYDEGVELLAVKVEYAAERPLGELALVIPVPSAPDAYAAVDAGLFEAMSDWVRLTRRRRATRGPGGGGGDRPVGVRLLEPARAGPYRIQPIQGVGDGAGEALARWLRENGFASPDGEALRHYTDRGWTFVAVRIDPSEGAEALAETGSLPPLRMRFATPRAVFPLMLERPGTFPMRLYLITRERPSRDDLAGARRRGFRVAMPARRRAHGLVSHVGRFELADAPGPVASLLEKAGDWTAEGALHLTTLFTPVFGRGRADPAGWDEELAIPPVDRFEGVPPLEPPGEPEAAEASEDEADGDGDDGAADGEADEGEAEHAPPGQASPGDPEAEAPIDDPTPTVGCGCRVGAAPGRAWGWLLAVGALLARRRRRSGRR